MMILAASSAFLTPVLLRLLLPLVSGGSPIQVNAGKKVATLLGAQLLPLGIGLFIRHRGPAFAGRLEKPARLLSLLLNLALLGTTAFGLFQTILVALIAPAWGRLAAATGK